jgi:hypothetical protein
MTSTDNPGMGDPRMGALPGSRADASSPRAASTEGVDPARVTREDFPPRPYGQRAWDIHRATGARPFEALSQALDEEREREWLARQPRIVRALRRFFYG